MFTFFISRVEYGEIDAFEVMGGGEGGDVWGYKEVRDRMGEPPTKLCLTKSSVPN